MVIRIAIAPHFPCHTGWCTRVPQDEGYMEKLNKKIGKGEGEKSGFDRKRKLLIEIGWSLKIGFFGLGVG